MSRRAFRSPSEEATDPASMTWTPISERSVAISSLCSGLSETPGVCSPSRSVVSKNRIFPGNKTICHGYSTTRSTFGPWCIKIAWTGAFLLEALPCTFMEFFRRTLPGFLLADRCHGPKGSLFQSMPATQVKKIGSVRSDLTRHPVEARPSAPLQTRRPCRSNVPRRGSGTAAGSA